MLSKLSDLSVIAEHVDSDDCLVERWIGGLHKVVVKMLLVIQAIEPLQNPSSALLPQPQSFSAGEGERQYPYSNGSDKGRNTLD